jgi:CheY-like chemotaxis protein
VVEHVAVPADLRSPPVPRPRTSGYVTAPDGAVGAVDGGGEPGQGVSLRAGLSSSGNRPWVSEARVRPGAGCCGRCDTCLVQLTVLIVDDHEGFRQMARALLEAEGIEVVGEAADGESAITEAERLRPRLVLLDVQLPGIDGFEVAARLGEASDPPAVVLTSSYAASSYRRRLAQSPARAFIPKGELSGEALAALLA